MPRWLGATAAVSEVDGWGRAVAGQWLGGVITAEDIRLSSAALWDYCREEWEGSSDLGGCLVWGNELPR